MTDDRVERQETAVGAVGYVGKTSGSVESYSEGSQSRARDRKREESVDEDFI